MSPERSIFPDKKIAETDYRQAVTEIQRQQEHAKRTEYAQGEATWLANGEYAELPIAVTFMTDVHFGAKGVDYELLNTHVKTIMETPNMFVLMGGDIIDAFNPTKHPSGISGDAIPVDEQLEAMMDLLTTFDRKGKLGAFQSGNHDNWSDVAGYRFERFLRELQAPVFSGAGNINTIVNGAQAYRIYWSHSHWGNSKLNISNAANRALQFSSPHADIALLVHLHQSSAENFDIGGEQKVAVVGGTYKRVDGWAGKWGMTTLGMPGYTLLLWPDRKRMDVIRDPQTARQIMRGLVQEYYMNLDDLDPYSEMIQRLNEQRRQKDERARS